MIVYNALREEFSEHVKSTNIDQTILRRFREVLGRGVAEAEIASWRNSLPFMNQALDSGSVPLDARVAIEYQIPLTSKRVDFLVSGVGKDNQENLSIVELKQWTDVAKTNNDAIVRTFIGGTVREQTHPSYQAWSYASLLESFNVEVHQRPIGIHPCAYLHNCVNSEVLKDEFYEFHTNKAPVYTQEDVEELGEFLGNQIRYGDHTNILQRVDQSRLEPSKELADHVASLIEGNEEFILIDEQKVVFEKALELARSSVDKKEVLIIEGGPGTGKSVVAIRLLGQLINSGKVAQYVTNNNAPREVYESKLAGSRQRSEIGALFNRAGRFRESVPNSIDVLVVDEAHRLMERWFRQPAGGNQVREIINTAKRSVFFLDQDQIVHFKDIGDRDEIKKWASAAGAEVLELKLDSQFRCNGSDGYLDWLDSALQIGGLDTTTLEGLDYEFKVVDSPNEMRELIRSRNEKKNKSRMVAGYCWNWEGRKDSSIADVVIPEHNFEMKWNLASQGFTWLIEEDSVNEIGCIHTCQGLELEYVGVIIGPDLVVREGEVITDGNQRAATDDAIKGYKKLLKENPVAAKEKADRIIKNTYRTLMSRGQKGCYIFCVDEQTQAYFKECIGS